METILKKMAWPNEGYLPSVTQEHHIYWSLDSPRPSQDSNQAVHIHKSRLLLPNRSINFGVHSTKKRETIQQTIPTSDKNLRIYRNIKAQCNNGYMALIWRIITNITKPYTVLGTQVH
jgi:hypothetical protein